ncbi:unnamed protein product [Amoebophrya sp. A120]|nr:unnamed protein product [Amoebophrya sp. A120]|eukprot:GSA120T00022317001.1
MVALQSLEKVAATSGAMKKEGNGEASPDGTARSTSSAAMTTERITKALNDGYNAAGRGKGSALLFRNTQFVFAAEFLERRNFLNLKKYLERSTGLSADGDEQSKSWAWHVASRRQGHQLMQIRADEPSRCVYTWKRLRTSGRVVPVKLKCGGGRDAVLPGHGASSKDVALQRFTLFDALQWVSNAPESRHCKRRMLISPQCRNCIATEVSHVARLHRQQHGQNQVGEAMALLRQRSFDNFFDRSRRTSDEDTATSMSMSSREMDTVGSGSAAREGDFGQNKRRAATRQLATGLVELFATLGHRVRGTMNCMEASKAFHLFRADVRSEQIRRHMTFEALAVKREAIDAILSAADTVYIFCQQEMENEDSSKLVEIRAALQSAFEKDWELLQSIPPFEDTR